MSEKKRKRDGQVGDLSSNKKMKEGGEFGSSRETPKIRTSDQVFRKKIRSSKRLGKREREGWGRLHQFSFFCLLFHLMRKIFFFI